MSIIAQLKSVHLLELRARLLKSISVIMVVFLALLYYSNDIYDFVAKPLIDLLPEGASMIATDVATPLLSPLKLTIMVSFFLAIPYVLYQLWAFVMPGLYGHEKKIVSPIFFCSVFLFYAGVAFAYLFVFPLIFSFFTNAAPAGVVIATDISSYLDFVLTLFLVFGLAFEVPVVVIILCWTGICTPQDLKKKRPYVIVWMFIIAMLVTPPDIFSQTLIAIPMCLLWEFGVLCAGLYCTEPSEVKIDAGG
ncbi:twin-arginine translocase subunit TatC [Aeromonas veronii]|uniref:twin-arginine translocase subunit TatC n=1 Tax=Aeromonas veronii TaxID=654 RepID=UPI00226CDAA1|nr:twin-arginine translocase subunit TatC [Aeromonas veronii]MCX9134854.1 twin-arginine translocase subunit TatC [Aeromonas veronii]